MTTRETLDNEDLRATVLAFRDLLRAREREINLLNVYPVRDADTGTNMALTAESVVAELESAATGEVARAVERGAVMGGRGNSGIILSQVLAAIARAFANDSPLDVPALARALESARDAAYAAVAEPVEGTILTLAEAAARSAAVAAADGVGLGETLGAVVADCERAVRRTRTQLAPLRAAGVVDAGALGLSLLFRALRLVVAGEDVDAVLAAQPPPKDYDAEAPRARYEVVFLLTATEDAVTEMRSRWRRDGESIAIAGGEGRYRCHVHTADPAVVLAAARRAGEVSDLEVTDLARQVEAARDRARSNELRVVVSPSLAAAATLVTELGAIVADDGSGDECIFIGPRDAERPPDVEAATVPHLLAALLAYDATQSRATNITAMSDAIAATAVACAPDLDRVLEAVAAIPDGDVEVVTLFVDATSVGDVARVERAVAERLPDVPLEVHSIPGLDPPLAIGIERPRSRGTETSL